MDNKTPAFISIDIAFAIVIMSFALFSLYHIHRSIVSGLASSDISNFEHTNKDLLNGIKQQGATKALITTKNNETYSLYFVSTDINGVRLDYYYIPVATNTTKK